MMGERRMLQVALFYSFNLDRHVPMDHLLRSIDRFVDLGGVREHPRPYYSDGGRPSIDPELLIRMLIVGYCFGIRSERRLTECFRTCRKPPRPSMLAASALLACHPKADRPLPANKRFSYIPKGDLVNCNAS